MGLCIFRILWPFLDLPPKKSLLEKGSKIKKRKRLNGGTVPRVKMHPGGTVPPFKMHPGGTVPPFKMHPGGTLSFYDIYFLSLILDSTAKINDRSLHPFCNSSLLIRSSFFISIVLKPLCLKCILEGQTLLLKCPCQLRHPFGIVWHGET